MIMDLKNDEGNDIKVTLRAYLEYFLKLHIM